MENNAEKLRKKNFIRKQANECITQEAGNVDIEFLENNGTVKHRVFKQNYLDAHEKDKHCGTLQNDIKKRTGNIETAGVANEDKSKENTAQKKGGNICQNKIWSDIEHSQKNVEVIVSVKNETELIAEHGVIGEKNSINKPFKGKDKEVKAGGEQRQSTKAVNQGFNTLSESDNIEEIIPRTNSINDGIEAEEEQSLNANVAQRDNKKQQNNEGDDFWKTAWKKYSWLSGQPSGKSKYAFVKTSMVYLFLLAIAVFIVYKFIKLSSTYTDVSTMSVSQFPIPIPDVIVCPAEKMCSACSPPFSSYTFSHDVWWNEEMLEFLNITESHLNLLSSTVHAIEFGRGPVHTPDELKVYFERAQRRVDSGYDGPSYTKEEQVQNNSLCFNAENPCRYTSFYMRNTSAGFVRSLNGTNSLTIEDLWYSVVQFPDVRFQAINIRFEESLITKFQMEDKFYHMRPSWVGTSYCLIYHNNNLEALNENGENIISSLYGNKLGSSVNIPEKRFKFWFGNLSLDAIDLIPVEKMVAYFETEYIFIEDFSKSRSFETKCQNNVSLLKQFDKCEPVSLEKYTLTKFHMQFQNILVSLMPHSTFGFVAPNTVWHVRHHNAYTMKTYIETIITIFQMILGVSFYQSIVLVASLLKIGYKRLRLLKVLLTLLLILAAAVYFAFQVLKSSEINVVNVISLGTGKVKHPVIIFQNNRGHTDFMNYTKVMELNVSLGLLHYIHIAANGNLPFGFAASENKHHHPLNWKYLTQSESEHRKRFDLFSCADAILKLHEEYRILSNKLGVDPSEPGYHIYEKLLVDKCQLIQYCIFDGKMDINCCKKFKYGRAVASGSDLILKSNGTTFFSEFESSYPDIVIRYDQNLMYNSDQRIKYAESLGNFSRDEYFRMPAFDKAQVIINYNDGILLNEKRFENYLLTGNDEGQQSKHSVLITLNMANSEKALLDWEKSNLCADELCYGQLNEYLNYFVNTAIQKFKLCGCYICFNHRNMMENLELNEKCCSPQDAVNCLGNPLLYTWDNSICPDASSTCDNPIPSRAIEAKKTFNCSERRVQCQKSLYYETYSENGLTCTKKHTLVCDDVDPSVVGCSTRTRKHFSSNVFLMQTMGLEKNLFHNYLNLDIWNISDLDWRNYGCNYNPMTYKLKPCQAYSTEISSKEPYRDLENAVAIQLNRKSSVNSFIQDRSIQDRTQNIFELIGLSLGGLGILLGLDLVSIIEGMIKLIFDVTQANIRHRCIEALEPAHRHIMRLFIDVVPFEENFDGAQKQKKEFSPKMAKVMCAIAMSLFVIGAAFTFYVGLSGMLDFNEPIFAPIKEEVSQGFPSFAACQKMRNDPKEASQQVKEMTLNGTKCWIGMMSRDCDQVFDLLVSTGSHYCWIIVDTLKFSSNKSLIGPFEQDFAFGNSKNGPVYEIWYGHLSAISNYSEILPQKWSDNTIVIFEEYRNLACSLANSFTAPCPVCNQSTNGKYGSSGMCCILQKYVSDAVLFEKHQCPKIFYSPYKQMIAPAKSASFLLMYFGLTSVWRENENEITSVMELYAAVHLNEFRYTYFFLKRSTPYVFVSSGVNRHSTFAKFGIIAGYLDMFIGVSLLSISGAFISVLIGQVTNILAGAQQKVLTL